MFTKHPITVVMFIAVLAPLLGQTRVGGRVPVAVLEVVLGVVAGPHILALVEFDSFLSSMKFIGTGALLFMAGMEIDFAQIRGRPLALASAGWVGSLLLALVAVGVLHVIPGVQAPMMVALALTTTGLGVLLPILRDGGQLETQFGRMVMAAGTVGEIGPIVAVSLVLSEKYSSWQSFGFLLAFLALVVVVGVVGVTARYPKLLGMLSRAMHSSTQLPVRLALFVMFVLLVISEEFGFEGIFGAFAAGMVVGLATRDEASKPFREKIDAICFGWFTPFFFIGTGIQYNLGALVHSFAGLLVMFSLLVLFLLVRGLPVLLYRRQLSKAEQLSFAFSSSVASLGLVVVISQIGLRERSMSADIAQALVGAALLSLLVYPTLMRVLLSRSAQRTAKEADAR